MLSEAMEWQFVQYLNMKSWPKLSHVSVVVPVSGSGSAHVVPVGDGPEHATSTPNASARIRARRRRP